MSSVAVVCVATFCSAVMGMGALKGAEVFKGELSNEISVTLAELW